MASGWKITVDKLREWLRNYPGDAKIQFVVWVRGRPHIVQLSSFGCGGDPRSVSFELHDLRLRDTRPGSPSKTRRSSHGEGL